MTKKGPENNISNGLNEPLAIIGMNCHFPGVDSDIEDIDAFHHMLMMGQSPIKDVPHDRWDIEKYYNSDKKKADTIINRKGGFLNNARLFDPDFFKLSHVEAKQIDPQHRLFLQVSIRALNHANIRLDSLSDSNTGVYCGIASQDYSQLNFKDNIQFNAYTQIGVASSAAVGRLCHFLNLKGPSLVVDTACSSSLSALYLAATSLRTQQCDMAIVGGVHLNFCPESFIGLSKANMLSPTGQCHTFDIKADGFVRSEGCGVIIVKRLSDAIQDHNTIHAIIKSIVMNQDGNGASLVAPNINAQIAMHQATLVQANMVAGDIDYIETHGTGTVMGDTVEFNAIQHIHQGHHPQNKPLMIGALKSNLGHTIAASGIASLIKAICALKNEVIPPNLHYSIPNKSIDPESIPAILPVKEIAFFKNKNKQRNVQISNFGFSGTNVSTIIEEPPHFELNESPVDQQQPTCFVISANSEHSLKQMIANHLDYLQESSASLSDICSTLINCRDHFKFRCAIIATNIKELIKKINDEDYELKKIIINNEIKLITNDANQIYEHYLSGVNIRLHIDDTQYNQVDLPLYIFDKQPYWHEPRPLTQQSSNHTTNLEPIAIIGMSCRFPKAANIDAFLSLLEHGESGMADIPLERWDNSKYYDADRYALGRLYIKQLGLIDNIKNFDAEFFNTSPREAKLMSPQLRILMETSYHALENANLSLDSIKNSNTGVFIGCERNEYPQLLIDQGFSAEELDIYFATGNAPSALPGRIAYAFDFHGPIQTVDTACSSAMTAIHNACLSLQAGDCNMALAGGINILLSPVSNIVLSKAQMLSPDSRCKTFSEDADGYARSEGCGLIILKRLSSAIKDKDNILAIIKGSAINSDGKSAGFTVPNSNAQEAVIRSALAKSNLSPKDIDYIEAHGTGTPVADPIEANTLTKIFSEHHSKDKPLYISSVKTNIGHCESASGIAGVIKAILSIQTQTLFKHLNFKQLNPAIQLTNMLIPLSNIHWHKEDDLRCVGINSFGFSGANAHVILQQAPRKQIKARTLPKESLLILSAKKKETLELLLTSYQSYLSTTENEFADICYTAATCRSHFLFRVAIKTSTALQAATLIKNNEYIIYQIKKEDHSIQQLCELESLQTAYQNGISIDWAQYYQSLDISFEKITLPLYEFARTEYWFNNKHKPTTAAPNNLKSMLNELTTPPSSLMDKPTDVVKENSLSTGLRDYMNVSDDKKFEACKDLLLDISKRVQERPTTDHLDEDDVALQHLYHTQWSTLTPNVSMLSKLPDFIVISNDPIKAKKRLGNLSYQLVNKLNNLEHIEHKNIIFLYEQGQFNDLFHCCQTLFKSPPKHFILVTEQAYAIDDNDKVNPYHTMASSFWKSFRNELDFNQNYTIDLDSNSTLVTILTYIFNADTEENQFAVRDSIYIPRLEKIKLPTYSAQQTPLFDRNASYLIVGGTGGLAHPLIEYLIQSNVKHLIIVSRSECSIETKALISDATKKQVSIKHYKADAGNYKQMETIVETIKRSSNPLKGIFHLAGVIEDGLIVNLTDKNIQNVLHAKMESALILHQLTQAIPLELFVLFSSVSSLLGGKGQSNYAAANGFLDGLAHLRRQQGRRTIAINWGPFHTVGMAANHTRGLQQHGFISLDKKSLHIIDRLLETKLAQISPCPIHWDDYFKHSPKQKWLSAQVEPSSPLEQHFLNSLMQHTEEECITIISQLLCDITADVLELDDREKITAKDELFAMGLDSLMSLEIRHRIHDKLQCKALSISIEYFINDPSIDKIARHITEELQTIFDSTTNNHSPENSSVKEVALCDFQYLFWVLNKCGYSSNVGMQLQLHGHLNTDYVLKSFDFVVNQNSAFWIKFNEDAPIQTLNTPGPFNLIYEDISLSNEINALDEAFYANIMRIMPLTNQPLIRVYLYKINNNLHELHLVIPHIIVDDVSCAIILNQFKKAYEAFAIGKKPKQTPEKNSFLNYVQQTNHHYEKNLNDKIDFWKAYNKDVQMLHFGSKQHLPDASIYQIKHLFHYPIAPQLIEPFINWHKEKNLNVSTGLIAACQIAFYNISRQKNIPIILIHSGREGSQYKYVVGLFAEYKRINISMNEGDTFTDCIMSIEEELLKTAPYQKCSLPIKDNGLKKSRSSVSHYISYALNKLFLTKYFKQSKLNTILIDYYLSFLSEVEANKKVILIKHKLNQLLNLKMSLQKPDRLNVLISITPSFFVKKTQERSIANLNYNFTSHFGCLNRPIGNKTLWVYFTKNQYGEHQLSINGPLTPACKDQIAKEFTQIISTFLNNTEQKMDWSLEKTV